MVTVNDICDHDLKKEIEILVKLFFFFFLISAIVFNMMKLLAHQQVNNVYIVSQFIRYNKNKSSASKTSIMELRFCKESNVSIINSITYQISKCLMKRDAHVGIK